jgi:hypothetical protein
MAKKSKTIAVMSMNELTYGEMELLEEVIGSLPDNMEEVPKSKMMIALGLISGRRVDPDLTLEDVRNLPVGALDFGGLEDTDPK